MSEKLVYIAANGFQDFSEQVKMMDQEGHRYEYINDDRYLICRAPGLIIFSTDFRNKWDSQSIMEAIEREKIVWEKIEGVTQEEFKEGLTKEDLDYGV